MPTLLVIDDERSIHSIFTKAFEDGGVKVVTASSAVEGLRQLEEQNPDAVILDVLLPDGRGLEVFSRIQEIDSRLPVNLTSTCKV